MEDYNNNAYVDPNSGGFVDDYTGVVRRVNLLEILVILLLLISIVLVFISGFNGQATLNRDKQRESDISQVLVALDYYYQDSSATPTNKKYPLSKCQQSANEVDFEYTLKRAISSSDSTTGISYIPLNLFPKDPWGIYSQTFSSRQLPLKACSELFNSDSDQIYANSWSSCNFSLTNKKYYKCYLYSGYENGEKFDLSYYSEVQNKFVLYSKFRTNPVQKELI
jgi:type II secretory pathway pseudopilin PulG